MARSRTSSFHLNAWPVFTDAAIAFVLVLVLLLLFQVARVTTVDPGGEERKRRQAAVAAAVSKLDGAEIQSETLTEQNITFNASALFASGSAEPQPVGQELLRLVAAAVTSGDTTGTVLRGIEISGHTDNVRTGGEPLFTNWELSSQRASNIARFLTEQGGIDPRRVEVSAAGYGEFKPVNPVRGNQTAQDRANNRRIEMRLFYN